MEACVGCAAVAVTAAADARGSVASCGCGCGCGCGGGPRQRQQRQQRRRPRWQLQGQGSWLSLQVALLLLVVLAATARAFVVPSPGGSRRHGAHGGLLQQGWQQRWQQRLQQQQQQSQICAEGRNSSSIPRGRSRAPQMIFNTLRPPKASVPPPSPDNPTTAEKGEATIVLMAGFEAFNVQLYKKAAAKLAGSCPSLRLVVFTDRDIAEQPEVVAAELAKADVFFGSLIFDYDQVSWLKERIGHIPARFVFESALELMGMTQVGSFSMASPAGSGGADGAPQQQQQSGPPPVVKALLSKFGSSREEDRLKGYLSFLKVGPKILKLVPGKKAQDLRTWLEVYSYWNQGGLNNVVSLFLLLARRFNLVAGRELPEPLKVVETPGQGLIHPLSPEIFDSPRKYLQWYLAKTQEDPAHAMAPATAPRVALLLYRKHYITNQLYIAQLIRTFEREGLLPVPVFINGVEGHTIVRDLLTTRHEQEERRKGNRVVDSLSPEAVEVDAIVNTIGFPLVGGPAGSMEAGRRVDVATRLLGAKNVPYFVSSPLLIQDIKSWKDNGVLGLQSAVLYSLPELDGAVDTVVLGGLVGDKIALVPERVRKLAQRIKGWQRLRATPAAERKVAVLLYGFPPNVGAIGTAALLNVPRSLEQLFKALQAQGYDTGLDADQIDGEAVVAVLTALSQEAVVAGGPKRMAEMVDPATTFGAGGEMVKARITAEGITADAFRQAVGDRTAERIEKMWGDLDGYVGLFTSQAGEFIVGGVQLGNVWVGVQPLLGIEGDPMRLMFERDLTPHPQYVAFYDWMRRVFGAQALVHFGMHGTAEWLPGSPLGNTATTWPDILMGDIPNIYLYAANNPSESILAKRRGYGTIVSHNVPAYSRAGLYKETAQLRELLGEYREQPEANAGLRPVVAGVLERTGLYEDCPFEEGPAHGFATARPGRLSAEEAERVPAAAFDAYAARLTSYLGVLEARLFSEGLHVLGEPPAAPQLLQYLDAYFDGQLPRPVLEVVAGLDTPPDAEPRALLPRLLGAMQATDPGLVESLGDLSEPRGPGAGAGYHWYESLSSEEKYELELWPLDLLRFYGLKIRRALGDAEAARLIAEEVAVAFGPEQDEGMKKARAAAEAAREQRETTRGRLLEALEIKQLLEQNTQELGSVVKALNGEYVLPGVGGDLLRDGTGVLPTGRNIHALDPYRLPSPAAWQRGQEAARKILEQHQAANAGAYPETVAVMLWGLDAIKTRGESVAILLALVGARPVKEATGRIVKYELVPLAELGRPRIDVLASLSGIFRDSFANVVDLLDDLFERAAAAEDEPPEMNYIRKHALKLEAAGVERGSARLFSNPAGDYGSLVNERVGNGDWEDETELGSTWQSRNAFSFGRGNEKGVNRGAVLEELLATTDRVVQEIDSVEYGLTDIQEYYANTGSLKKAAETAGGKVPGKAGKKVRVSIIESFAKEVEAKDLEATLRMEYRSKLLNPKWAQAMAAQGSGGAYEISQRMTALVGWGATAEFREQWVFDGAVETYALDPEMAKKLADSNPEAFRNIVKRMLEAHGRGYWEASDDVLEQLRDLYAQTEDEIEWSGGKGVRTSVFKQDPAAAAATAAPSAAAAAAAAAPAARPASVPAVGAGKKR